MGGKRKRKREKEKKEKEEKEKRGSAIRIIDKSRGKEAGVSLSSQEFYNAIQILYCIKAVSAQNYKSCAAVHLFVLLLLYIEYKRMHLLCYNQKKMHKKITIYSSTSSVE